jgi:hypothetical protein
MKSAVQSLGIAVEYSTVWPDDLNIYSSIFVCLGIYNSNHVLENAEGQRLADYLENGGNVYMEGGDTWCYDDPTPVHSMFNIEKQVDGSDDLDSLKGLAGTFTEEMSFAYGGDNEFIDHILPISPAYSIFENNFPPYFAAVAHDAEDYKTIGSSFEFGGLINGSGVNAKVELMKEYLKFFGLRAVTASPDKPEGDEEVCTNSSGEYTTSVVEQADFYFWSIEPANAGTVNGIDTIVSITWASDYYGMAKLSVCGMNTAGLGPVSDTLEINVSALPAQAETPSGPETVNTDEEPVSSFSTSGADFADNYEWQIVPEEAYSAILPDGMTANISWSGDYKGEIQLTVRGINDCGEGLYSEALNVILENSFGIDENNDAQGIEIYPNPNGGNFILNVSNKAAGKINLSIINATGVVVYKQHELNIKRDFTTTIDISKESEGLYLIIVEYGNKLFTSRLILRK